MKLYVAATPQIVRWLKYTLLLVVSYLTLTGALMHIKNKQKQRTINIKIRFSSWNIRQLFWQRLYVLVTKNSKM